MKIKTGQVDVVYTSPALYKWLSVEMDFTDWFKGYIESLNLIKDQVYSDYSPSKGVNSDIK